MQREAAAQHWGVRRQAEQGRRSRSVRQGAVRAWLRRAKRLSWPYRMTDRRLPGQLASSTTNLTQRLHRVGAVAHDSIHDSASARQSGSRSCAMSVAPAAQTRLPALRRESRRAAQRAACCSPRAALPQDSASARLAAAARHAVLGGVAAVLIAGAGMLAS